MDVGTEKSRIDGPISIDVPDSIFEEEPDVLRIAVAARIFLSNRFEDLRNDDWEKDRPISHGNCRTAAKFLVWLLDKHDPGAWIAVEGKCRYASHPRGPMDAHCYAAQREILHDEPVAIVDVTADQFGWAEVCMHDGSARSRRWEDEAAYVETYRSSKTESGVLNLWKREWRRLENDMFERADEIISSASPSSGFLCP